MPITAVSVLKALGTASGSYEVKSSDTKETVVISTMKTITIEGQPTELIASTNPKYPSSDGWFAVVKKDGGMKVVKVAPSGGEPEIVTIKGEMEIKATVTRKGGGPEPEIPDEGKY